VTAITYANSGWRREDGGKLRLWIPAASQKPREASLVSLTNDRGAHHGSPPASHHHDASSEPNTRPGGLDPHPAQASGIGVTAPNGLPNGHFNGLPNGHSNGLPNGHSNGYLNGAAQHGTPACPANGTFSYQNWWGEGVIGGMVLFYERVA